MEDHRPVEIELVCYYALEFPVKRDLLAIYGKRDYVSVFDNDKEACGDVYAAKC